MFSGIIKSCYGSNLLKELVDHPFNTELVNNTLNIESFKFYIQQDMLFTDEYNRAVLIIASRIEDNNNIMPLIRVAQAGVAFKKVLQDHYFNVYNISYVGKSLSCFNFTNFLLSISYSNTREAITVLYSCMFVYKAVFESVKRRLKENNRFKDLFNLCGGQLGELIFTTLEGLIDEYSNKANERQKSRMLELFRITARFELDFWDSAYNFPSLNMKGIAFPNVS